jgi:hypothetical protein
MVNLYSVEPTRDATQHTDLWYDVPCAVASSTATTTKFKTTLLSRRKVINLHEHNAGQQAMATQTD